MKKIFILLLSICVITACNNEPLDDDFFTVDDTPTDDPIDPIDPTDTDSDDLTLKYYSYYIDTSLPATGDLSIYKDYNMSNNTVSNVNIQTVTATLNTSTRSTIEKTGTSITSIITLNAGALDSETIITGTGSTISQIDHLDSTNPAESYNYTFTQTVNTVERLKTGTTERTVFTFNEEQLIKKQVFDGATSVSIEVLNYDTNGNCINNIIVGASGSTTTYGFDTNTNPLKSVFNDQFYISIFNSEASDNIGASIAQFYSTNNWKSVTTSEGTTFFTIDYNLVNRIQSRAGNYSTGNSASNITQDEIFTYVN